MKKPTLVLGASTNPSRYSNIAIKRLRQYGHPVLALGLREGEVEDVHIDTEVTPEMQNIHTITLYVGPQNQPVYYTTILELHPQRVIFNPGTENPELEKRLREKNIFFEHACTLVLLSLDNY